MKIISAIVDEMPEDCMLCRFCVFKNGKSFCKLNYKAIKTINGYGRGICCPLKEET